MTCTGYATLAVDMANSISSSYKVSTSFNVVNRLVECGNPILGVNQRAGLFYVPRVYKRNSLISIVGTVSLRCNLSLANAKLWRIYKMNATTGQIEQQMSLKDNPTENYAELVLQPKTLEYGVYKVVFEVTMSSTRSMMFTDRIDTHVKIVPSGLVISSLRSSLASGGGTLEITRGSNQAIEFNPFLNSYDLDGQGTVFDLKFKYYCQVIENGVQM